MDWIWNWGKNTTETKTRQQSFYENPYRTVESMLNGTDFSGDPGSTNWAEEHLFDPSINPKDYFLFKTISGVNSYGQAQVDYVKYYNEWLRGKKGIDKVGKDYLNVLKNDLIRLKKRILFTDAINSHYASYDNYLLDRIARMGKNRQSKEKPKEKPAFEPPPQPKYDGKRRKLGSKEKEKEKEQHAANFLIQ